MSSQSKKLSKTIEIVAGPNGSGKSSFAESYFHLKSNRPRFMNPDIIAAGISSVDFEQSAFSLQFLKGAAK